MSSGDNYGELAYSKNRRIWRTNWGLTWKKACPQKRWHAAWSSTDPTNWSSRGVTSPWKILWEQLTGIMVIMLIISAVISFLLEEYTDAITILIIVVLNAALGFTQEYRAEQAMAALKKMATPRVKVRRGGHTQEIPAQGLVPGDVILLEAGNSIPADCRLVESANLRVQESVLTGESEPVEKHTHPLEKFDLPVADRRNMLYMGTIATYGRGSAFVVATGMKTQLGHIADMIQTTGPEKTPLQRRWSNWAKDWRWRRSPSWRWCS